MKSEELESVKEELWYFGGGPEKASSEHAKLAGQSLYHLTQMGYKVVHTEYTQPLEYSFPVMMVVVVKDEIATLIRWQPFNRGWMRKMESGCWVIFR